MEDCLFCKIIRRQIEAELIYEDKETIAFLDVNPLTLGHTLIVPKYHTPSIIDLPDNLVDPTFTTLKRVTEMLNRALSPQGFTIGINHGKISGQAVDHLHLHIIPRYKGDGGGSIHSVVRFPPKMELPEVKEKIISLNKS